MKFEICPSGGQVEAPAEEPDYYRFLGLGKYASQKAIKSAYKRLAHLLHPDHRGTEEEFKKLGEAYATLSDPEKRMLYDASLSPPRQTVHCPNYADYAEALAPGVHVVIQ